MSVEVANMPARASAAVFLLNLLLGVMVTVRGPTVPLLLDYFNTTESVIGVMFAWVTVGGALAVAVGGRLSDKLGPGAIFVAGLVISCASFASFGLVRSVLLAQISMLSTGIGAGLIQGASNGFALSIKGRRGRALLNISQFFFGIGAISGPLLAGLMMRNGHGFQAAFQVVALLVASCGLTLLLLPRKAGSGSSRMPWFLLSGPGFWRLSVLGILYITLELGIGEWIASLLVRRLDVEPEAAAFWSSLFWGGVALGRLLTGAFFSRVPAQSVTRVAACAVPPCLLVLLVTSSPGLAFLALGVTGLALAPIFPALLGMSAASAPANEGGAAGIVASMSVLGASLLRPLMALLSSWSSLSMGFAFFLLLSLIMCGITVKLPRAAVE